LEWKKAPLNLVEFLADKMKYVQCDFRKMFGYPAYFVNGNMFTGLHEDRLFVRLSKLDAKEILEEQIGAKLFEPMTGRPMKQYVVLPKEVYCNPELFNKWLQKSYQYVKSLPPKKAKS